MYNKAHMMKKTKETRKLPRKWTFKLAGILKFEKEKEKHTHTLTLTHLGDTDHI